MLLLYYLLERALRVSTITKIVAVSTKISKTESRKFSQMYFDKIFCASINLQTIYNTIVDRQEHVVRLNTTWLNVGTWRDKTRGPVSQWAQSVGNEFVVTQPDTSSWARAPTNTWQHLYVNYRWELLWLYIIRIDFVCVSNTALINRIIDVFDAWNKCLCG